MKNKLWLLQLPFIIGFSFVFFVTELGVRGDLENHFLRETAYRKVLRNISTAFTDVKFKLRGPTQPKNKIVIVEIDSASLDTFGRWPWHRDVAAHLIHAIFEAGAKVVGLDIVFSEPDVRVPAELGEILKAQNLGGILDQFETDQVLKQVITGYKDRLVLGWATESFCQPRYFSAEECPVLNPDALAQHPPGIDRFTLSQYRFLYPFAFDKTPVFSLATFISNLDAYNEVASHQGYFNIEPDPDGYVRRIPLLMLAQRKPFPALALEMARVGLGEELSVDFGKDSKVESLKFAKSDRLIPINRLGIAEINFRGPGRTFTYVPALDILTEGDEIQDQVSRKLAGASKQEILKDAYVLIGLSAIGVYDMRAFPFDSNVAGVEGHASILDNLLSNDFIVRGGGNTGWLIMLALMIFGALAFGYAIQRLESVPALVLFIVVFSGLSVVDVKVFFANNVNWESGFLYLELLAIFVMTLAAKYVIEERSKKFVKGAFAKYVAPAVVDSILKDPTKLSVGGEKRDLTILFSDIRGFTTFSERMDAKALAAFLNDYLGIMTQIVFAHQGTLDKYIGDAVMAFWGAPLDQKKHAENALIAARAMMKALAENKERFLKQYGVEVNVGVGINSGAVNVGNMGSSNNFAYTVIGDHVNLASRLEGLTKPYHVNILTTRFTLDALTGAGATPPPHRTLDHVKVKGKKKAVELIQVLDHDLPREVLQMFEEARELYQFQHWDEAIEKFKGVNAKVLSLTGASDGPSEMYIERCQEFKSNPPPAGWDGSWEMTSK